VTGAEDRKATAAGPADVRRAGGLDGGAPRPFSCLWCGRSWQPRAADDLEARARLCPDCLGRAGENPFLRFRLRAGLEAGGGAGAADTAAGAPAAADTAAGAHAAAGAADTAARARAAAAHDDWYLRRGPYAHGPVHDLAWQMELDAATTWLDGLPLHGEIVELAASTGWWSALLATKGDLHAYDASEAALDRARNRLLAHRLRAHLHVRDAWAAPDRRVDAVFAGFWLGRVPRDRLAAFLELARAWLRPGGVVAFIDALPDPASGPVGRLRAPGPDLAGARPGDGHELVVPQVHHAPDDLAASLAEAGFAEVAVRTTGRFFVLASASAA
jgi:demethylmenaquinone methyltransferase/2-methoxy-6-polyprenyl-1,4-benzoquinol methylase